MLLLSIKVPLLGNGSSWTSVEPTILVALHSSSSELISPGPPQDLGITESTQKGISTSRVSRFIWELYSIASNKCPYTEPTIITVKTTTPPFPEHLVLNTCLYYHILPPPKKNNNKTNNKVCVLSFSFYQVKKYESTEKSWWAPGLRTYTTSSKMLRFKPKYLTLRSSLG